MFNFVSFVTGALFVAIVSADTCLSPEIKSVEYYTGGDTSLSTETAVILEFSLSCKNGLKDMNLYAEFNGKTVSSSHNKDKNKYQFSWIEERKNIPSGSYPVRIFDEEGYADLRKAQRAGEDTKNIKSLVSVRVDHKGSTQKTYVQSELVAVGVAGLVAYYAYSTRQSLMSSL